MKPSKATASILSLIASGSLGVDAMVFDDTVLSAQTDIIAEERVEVRQIENLVEAKAPWKGEQGISIKYDMGEPSFTDRVKDRRKQEVIYEAVDFGDGGFKIDVLLTEKPSTNRFCYTIEGAENYDFFYQPPLTEQEKAEGTSRPPEIEGSYAVYHKTLKNHVIGQENYATGKVMHIPRPQVWELGNEEATKQWADLSYENGQLCVTAPQDFIDNADYTNGVRIDPTFGYTTVGGSFITMTHRSAQYNVYRWGNPFTTISDGVITDISLAICSADVGFDCGAPDSPNTANVFVAASKKVNQRQFQTYVSADSNIEIPLATSWVTIDTADTAFSRSDTNVLNVVGDADQLQPMTEILLAGDYSGGTLLGTSTASTSLSLYEQLKNEDPWTHYPDGSVVGSESFMMSIYATYNAIYDKMNKINNGTIRINNGTLDL